MQAARLPTQTVSSASSTTLRTAPVGQPQRQRQPDRPAADDGDRAGRGVDAVAQRRQARLMMGVAEFADLVFAAHPRAGAIGCPLRQVSGPCASVGPARQSGRITVLGRADKRSPRRRAGHASGGQQRRLRCRLQDVAGRSRRRSARIGAPTTEIMPMPNAAEGPSKQQRDEKPMADCRRLPPGGASPVRQVRARHHRSPRLPVGRHPLRRRRRDRGRPARGVEPALRVCAEGAEGRSPHQGGDAGVRIPQGIGQGERLPGQAGQRHRQAARRAGDPREPRPESAYRGHRPAPGARQLRRLRPGCAVHAGRLSGRRGQGEGAVPEARPGEDPRGLRRRREPAAGRMPPSTAGSASSDSAMAAASPTCSPRACRSLRRRCRTTARRRRPRRFRRSRRGC